MRPFESRDVKSEPSAKGSFGVLPLENGLKDIGEVTTTPGADAARADKMDEVVRGGLNGTRYTPTLVPKRIIMGSGAKTRGEFWSRNGFG